MKDQQFDEDNIPHKTQRNNKKSFSVQKRRRSESMDSDYVGEDPVKKKGKNKKLSKITEKKENQQKQKNISKSKNKKIDRKIIKTKIQKQKPRLQSQNFSSSNTDRSSNNSKSSSSQSRSEESISKQNKMSYKQIKSDEMRKSKKIKSNQKDTLEQQNFDKEKSVSSKTVKSKDKVKPNKSSKPKSQPKEESINEIMRQYSKISRKKKRKSNFYLDKIDSMKWGEPVGRGAKKIKEKMQQINRIRRQKERQRKKQQKKERQLRKLALISAKKENQEQVTKLQPIIQPKIQIKQKIQIIQDNEPNKRIQNHQKHEICHRLQFTINKLQLQKLIDSYTVNAFDFKYFNKKLPQLTFKTISYNLKVLFIKCFSKIQLQFIKLCKQKIQLLKQDQKQILVRELCVIKPLNKLLNTNDHLFNEYFNRTIYSILNPSLEFKDYEARLLWQKISGFVRCQCKKQGNKQQNSLEVEEVKRQQIQLNKNSNDQIESINIKIQDYNKQDPK